MLQGYYNVMQGYYSCKVERMLNLRMQKRLQKDNSFLSWLQSSRWLLTMTYWPPCSCVYLVIYYCSLLQGANKETVDKDGTGWGEWYSTSELSATAITADIPAVGNLWPRVCSIQVRIFQPGVFRAAKTRAQCGAGVYQAISAGRETTSYLVCVMQ